MNTHRLVIVIVTAGLAGCASVSLPPEAAAVSLSPLSSKAVAVEQPKLSVRNGRLALDGWVSRQYGAWTTAGSHLDIAFVDGAGREIRREVTRFAPSVLQVGAGQRLQPRGHYSLPIEAMPPGTVAIQVRAHDSAEHGS